MSKDTSVFNWFKGAVRVLRKTSSKILTYLSCRETDALNDRNLLRELYSAGQIDEIKYQDCCDQCSTGDFDPEELNLPT